VISAVFIARPRLAAVISIVITLAGALAMLAIPVAQYPNLTPPTVNVAASYPGASAEEVAESVGAPLEAEINGVEGMIYMASTSSNTGQYSLDVTFEIGADPDLAQVNVQNRAQLATPRLPAQVSQQGLSIRTRSPDFLLALAFYAPAGTRDVVFISNYASINVRDALARIAGVGEATVLSALDYSMRIWMNPERMASLGIAPGDVIAAIERQNLQASAGQIGAPPAPPGQQVQYTLRAQGRLRDVDAFERIIVRTRPDGAIVRIRDIAPVELGARSYAVRAEFNGAPAAMLMVYRAPGANAVETVDAVRAELERLAARFPADLAYHVVYDATRYVRATIVEILLTLALTFAIVVAVTYLFLQDWRAALVPSVTIPVSLIGAFAVLLALGFSANTITLFALILAIGLVVDDAIVVVENVQRIMQDEGLEAAAAARKAMTQVTGPIIATTLVLLAVFVPVALLPGLTGQLYRQFAVTISAAVVISTVNALTLSPALCATLLRPPGDRRRGPLAYFARALDASRDRYARIVAWLVRRLRVAFVVVALSIAGTYALFVAIPTTLLPQEDQGAVFVDVQLPEAASLERTEEVMAQVREILAATAGVEDVVAVSGFSILSGTLLANTGLVLAVLEPWEERTAPEEQLDALLARLRGELAAIPMAEAAAFAPPAIPGVGSVSGFDFRLQALEGQSPEELAAALRSLIVAANQEPAIAAAFSTFSADVPQVFVDLDRAKAETLGVSVAEVYRTLQAQLGSFYVNDFNLYDRVYQVRIQADGPYRDDVEDVNRLYARSTAGEMVPLRTLISLSTVFGPDVLSRYNQFLAAQINGEAAPGASSGEAMAALERLAATTLPAGYGWEWSGLSYQERRTSGQAPLIFALAFVFAYLFLVGSTRAGPCRSR